MSLGQQGIDPLISRAPGATESMASNKKVVRQAREGGADGNRVGGGTLFSEPALVVNQKARLVGSSLEYAIYSQAGQKLGAVEEVRGLGAKASDKFRGRTDDTRSYQLRIVDMNGRVLLRMTRPELGWFSFKSKVLVRGPDDRLIGQIARETYGMVGAFATLAHTALNSAPLIAGVGIGSATTHAIGSGVGKVVGKVAGGAAAAATELSGVPDGLSFLSQGLDRVSHVRFGLEAGGERLGSIHAETIDEWDFRIQNPSGTEVARITKTWAGWAKERFTKADNYVVLMHRHLEPPLHCLVIASAVAIDIALKQGDPTTGARNIRRYQ